MIKKINIRKINQEIEINIYGKIRYENRIFADLIFRLKLKSSIICKVFYLILEQRKTRKCYLKSDLVVVCSFDENQQRPFKRSNYCRRFSLRKC